MGSIDDKRIFHADPRCQHASVRPSKSYDGAVLAVLLFNELQELDKVHQSFLSCEVDKVLFFV